MTTSSSHHCVLMLFLFITALASVTVILTLRDRDPTRTGVWLTKLCEKCQSVD